MLSQAKNIKGTNAFINEHLTHNNAELARLARQYKKRRLIQSTRIRNCKIFIRTIGSNPENSTVFTILEKSYFIKYGIGALAKNALSAILFHRTYKI